MKEVMEKQKPTIKTNIEFDEQRDKFVIVCENLETLNQILNKMHFASLTMQGMQEATKLTNKRILELARAFSGTGKGAAFGLDTTATKLFSIAFLEWLNKEQSEAATKTLRRK